MIENYINFHNKTSRTTLIIDIARNKERELEDRYGQPPVRQLVVDGVWQIPEWERPKGWEKYGARESKAVIKPV